ncbi:GDP-mannose 4,6 dehydratase [Luteibacter rhizovicinus DSM 16549]|uniref:GDP-mannose 4,6 dehydratase n=1 Tax=Luteibacter rhizovicinus DSM 16549 TaxID=1440763 RepID=A0A0G9HAK4_9GAMM|nr:NAD-dependent epimerase/dehydratase family protein [Luteibacter rhizovicinus]APG04436.1 GDP-mannose 4,6 dehydratase [Luteibacter rhizovicinus DSM 16549]KLD66264.1 GDP-6-deoxy-D-lyxo-4-hexulose reductase [Luteibacter rhizovicinus DSM 16549]KLD79084.1 GDP-6-deoxy-D-lyxo-4-hexulose reductase [Xanthomonas hyacinthi DSM 19077]
MTPRSEGAPGRVLVTGHKGFTGHYVVAALRAAGYQVLGLVEQPENLEAPSVNLLDRTAVARAVADARPDAVIHLAAIAFVAHGDADEMYRTNVVGTRHLMEALAALPKAPGAVLLASSANVYGNSDVELLSESVEPSPANDYAVSKLAMEYMAKLWSDRLPIVLARPFNYTGVGQADNFLLPKIVSHFQRGERVIELGNIDVARDFQDVRFVADAYVRLLSSNAAGQTVNLCSGTSVSLMQVIGMMQEIAGYEIEVRVNPAFVRGNEVARLTGDNRRLQSLVGPLDIIPLRTTLEWMFANPLPAR